MTRQKIDFLDKGVGFSEWKGDHFVQCGWITKDIFIVSISENLNSARQ